MFEAGDGRVTRASVLGSHLPGADDTETGSGYPEVAQAFFGSADHHGIYNEPTFQSVLLRAPASPGAGVARVESAGGQGARMTAAGRFLASSIGKKVVMAVTGVVLFGFVVGHMLGNLQVYLGPEALNALRRGAARLSARSCGRRASACWSRSACTSGPPLADHDEPRGAAAWATASGSTGSRPTPRARCAGAA